MKRTCGLTALWLCLFCLCFSNLAETKETYLKKIEKESELFLGYKAEGRVGDYKLSNDFVSFIIEEKRISSGFSLSGGGVVDAVIRERNVDLFEEAFPLFVDEGGIFNMRTFKLEEIEVVSSGGKGKEAVLRAKGVDGNIPLFDEHLKESTSQDLQIVIDYILKPEVKYLTVKLSVKNIGDKNKNITTGQAFAGGDWLKFFNDAVGLKKFLFERNLLGRKIEHSKRAYKLFGGVSQEGVSYGFYSPYKEIQETYKNDSLYLAFYQGFVSLVPGEEASFTYNLIIGQGDVESIKENIFEESEDEFRVEGKIIDERKKPAKGAQVLIESEGNFKTYILTNSKGKFSAHLKGGNYQGFIFSEGKKPTIFEFEVASPKKIEITIPASSFLKFWVFDQNKLTVPAALCFKRLDNEIDYKLYEKINDNTKSGDFFRVYFSLGKEKIKIEPGKYKIYFHQGFEYEISEKEVEIKEGETKALKVKLPQVIFTDGYLSGNFHLHTVPSSDSNDLYEDKIRSYLASGLDIIASTDHDYITDISPYLKKLKQEKNLMAIAGSELTTRKYGHFNPYPMVIDKDAWNNGALWWPGLTPPELFKKLRKEHPDVLIQVNHPSYPGNYFRVVGLDSDTGNIKNQDIWSGDFDTIEVFNGKRQDQLAVTLPDWFSLLNKGAKYTATGNSDSHRINSLEVGYPRNYILLWKNKVSEATLKEVLSAIKKQKVVVVGGPFIDFKIDGKSLGELTRAKNGSVLLKIKVQTTSWAPINKITIIANGKEIRMINAENRRIIDEVVLDTPGIDTWYIVVAEGDKDLYPVYPGAKPYSFTNPIYVDVDGNGKFDAPNLQN